MPVTGTLAGPVSTSNDLGFDALGGPTVTVTVRAPGLISVAASALGSEDDGGLSLYEDGVQLPGQADTSGACGPDGLLFTTFAAIDGLRWGTGLSLGLGGCTSQLGAPSPVIFQTTPGTHTYELRYAYCGCAGTEAEFSDVWLAVTPL